MVNRREFCFGVSAVAGYAAAPVTIVDTHIHLYDPGRPQGVPWPPKNDDVLYKQHLIPEFRASIRGLNVSGAIVIEASAWPQDNDWLLNLAAKEPMILGVIGNIAPGSADAVPQLERLLKNPLFRGIRRGGSGLAGNELPLLAHAGLTLDVLGDSKMLAAVLRLSERLPSLRIVIDHLPFAEFADLREFAARKNVYAKVSWILRRTGGHVPEELAFYRDSLDQVWEVFGKDRVVYGSNWPVSNKQASYSSVLRIAREYFAAKGRDAEEAYFWRNSRVAYGWKER